MTVAELRAVLRGEQGPYLRNVYLGRLMREASLSEVWKFATPREVQEAWPDVRPHLGRRKQFWEYLFGVWTKHGLLHG